MLKLNTEKMEKIDIQVDSVVTEITNLSTRLKNLVAVIEKDSYGTNTDKVKKKIENFYLITQKEAKAVENMGIGLEKATVKYHNMEQDVISYFTGLTYEKYTTSNNAVDLKAAEASTKDRYKKDKIDESLYKKEDHKNNKKTSTSNKHNAKTGTASKSSAGTATYDKETRSKKEIQKHDLKKFSPLTAEQMNAWIKKVRPDSPFNGHGDYFIEASKKSGLDPRYLLAHAATETGWGTSKIAKKYHNYFGIGAFDSNPGHSKTYSNTSMKDGIVNGAVWIAKHYYNSQYKQTTIYKMRYNNGSHQYCTSKTWVDTLSSIMARGPKNTK